MTPDYPRWKFYMDLSQLAGTVAVFIYVWWSNREKVTSKRFAVLEKEVAERVKLQCFSALEQAVTERVKQTDLKESLSERNKQCLLHKQDIKQYEQETGERIRTNEKKIERIGAEIRNLPQHRHITELSVRVEQLHGDVHEVIGALPGLKRAVDLMNEFLINRKV